jgi:hypothetical protein
VVPILHEGEFASNYIDTALENLKTNGSVAAPGFMNPEGIVIFAGGTLFKKTLGGDGHKGAK